MPTCPTLRPGQHAVITGGSSGLGLALATALARRRLDVTLLARNRDRLNQARDRIVSVVRGARVRLYAVDVSDFDATRAAVDDLTASGQGIDVVINSAGIVREGYFETLETADFRTVMDTDFVGVLNVARLCLPHLKATSGRIVNVSSMAGLVGVFGQSAYCAAKHAVNGFSEALRLELEPQGITVQLVCPAEFDSPLVEELNTYRSGATSAISATPRRIGVPRPEPRKRRKPGGRATLRSASVRFRTPGRRVAYETARSARQKAGQRGYRCRVDGGRHAFDLSWQVVTSPEQAGAAQPATSDSSAESDVPEQFRIRKAKRERLLAEGREPYPVDVARTHTLAEIRRAYPDLPANAETGQIVGVAGRVMFARNSGKLCFALLQEGDGTQLQVMVSLDRVGQESLDAWKADVDLGDIAYVHGEVISSRRGELSVLADSWQIVSKALRPLPVAHKEMSEESRVRQRYVDLIVRPEARTIARQRVAVVRAVRSALERRGFLEVETPMLQTLAGGAAARPFVTHSNALDADLYLRIAPELFLKRCLVGGFDKVFELNRVFRNEGADWNHSPEFAMLETYQAYGTYDDSAVMTREVIQEVADEAIGTRQVPLPDGTTYDLDGEWQALQMYPSLSEALGEEITPQTPAEHLWKIAEELGVEIPHDRGYGHGKLVEELWEHTVGNKLWAPTFVRDFPVETTPLTRAHRSIEGVTEKWDLYLRRIELATGYSELIDPVIQRERFEAQARAAAAGDDEAMALDEDFLAALEYAMPPSTGTGMGIDRLLMALTGLSIRETVLFPIVRRHGN